MKNVLNTVVELKDISNIEKLKLSNKISEKANLEIERRDA
jgi:hypothetical protein